jgi:hypothetical protein
MGGIEQDKPSHEPQPVYSCLAGHANPVDCVAAGAVPVHSDICLLAESDRTLVEAAAQSGSQGASV